MSTKRLVRFELQKPRYEVIADENGIRFWVLDTQTQRRLRPEYDDEGEAQADAEHRNKVRRGERGKE